MKWFIIIGVLLLFAVLACNQHSSEGFENTKTDCEMCREITSCEECADSPANCSWWNGQCYNNSVNNHCKDRPDDYNSGSTCDTKENCSQLNCPTIPNPDAADASDVPNVPDTSDVPDTSVVPDMSDSSDAPNVPDASDVSGTTDMSDNGNNMDDDDNASNNTQSQPTDPFNDWWLEQTKPTSEGFKSKLDPSNIFSFYEDRIEDKKRPPNAYFNRFMEYTPETVMADVNNVDNRLENIKQGLPGMVAGCVRDSIHNL
jgi:hypothetical protein